MDNLWYTAIHKPEITPRLHNVGEFDNDVYNLKTHQMFSVDITPEEVKNATITGHFGFVFDENSGRKIT